MRWILRGLPPVCRWLATVVVLCVGLLGLSRKLGADDGIAAQVGPGGTASAASGHLLAQATRKTPRIPTGKSLLGPRGGPQASGESDEPKSPTSSAASPNPDAAGDRAPTAGLFGKLVRFIRAQATWIITGLGALLVGLVVWTVLAAERRRPSRGDVLEDLGLGHAADPKAAPAASKTRYSSTKIQKADVTAGLGSNVTTTEVETDREYALVVDEEALKMPPPPEDERDEGSRPQGDSKKVAGLLEAKKPVAAFDEYERQVKAKSDLIFPPDLELALGECLMQTRDFEKAARVLERHVSTHRKEDVRADAYFNLGYTHFMNRAFNKSRRYFKLFLQVEKNPEYLSRARMILEKMAGPGKRQEGGSAPR